MLGPLRSRVAGAVLVPGDDGYDRARAVWNAMADRRPGMIVRCTRRADVVMALRHAREHDLEIGVRCGGHGVVGLAVPEGGLMIDLTPMSGVRIDAERRRARVQGGAQLGAIDRATERYRLATTAGNVSHTGGGGNFGVVTEFEFRLHPVTGRALLVEFGFALDDAATVLRGWRDLSDASPRQATFTASVGEVEGRPVASVGFVWIGEPDQGRRLLPALGALGRRPLTERVEELSYLELQRIDDDGQRHGLRRYWKGHYLDCLPDEAIEAFLLRGTADGRGDWLPTADLQAYGGAIADVAEGDTAFGHRHTRYEFVARAGWSDPAEDERRMAAARRYAARLDRFASGAYVTALTDEGQAGVRRAYPPPKRARLTSIKDRWDPANVFHLNHNIRPSAQAGTAVLDGKGRSR